MSKSTMENAVLGFRVSEQLLRRIDCLAQRDHRSRSQMARLLIEEALRRKEESLAMASPLES